ncbi:MAG: hypothetical protein H6562_12480 [Lewinellaceae bacterium]|nr:hypothetical protein [Lewinella sp.]MCB9279728.1 hypothetical protein [Lewinellaceae bacterium]
MRTVTIDIINDKALNLLLDLELLELIRLREEKHVENTAIKDWTKYKGSMTKQVLNEVDQQLNTLRSEWE